MTKIASLFFAMKRFLFIENFSNKKNYFSSSGILFGSLHSFSSKAPASAIRTNDCLFCGLVIKALLTFPRCASVENNVLVVQRTAPSLNLLFLFRVIERASQQIPSLRRRWRFSCPIAACCKHQNTASAKSGLLCPAVFAVSIAVIQKFFHSAQISLSFPSRLFFLVTQ